jgi:hypothetical protein
MLQARLAGSVFAAACSPVLLVASSAQADDSLDIRHVLLISVDGMHALCSHGISGVNDGAPYCPRLAKLARTGVNYLDTSTSKPSDSFPGLMALATGGSPRSVGAFYDVAYDCSLDPPATTTGNGVAGAPGLCRAGTPPTGTTTEFDEGIDINQLALNGGAPARAWGVAAPQSIPISSRAIPRIGKMMVSARGLLDSTLIVISASIGRPPPRGGTRVGLHRPFGARLIFRIAQMGEIGGEEAAFHRLSRHFAAFRLRQRRIRLLVELSWSSLGVVLASSSETMRCANTLPSSTPH